MFGSIIGNEKKWKIENLGRIVQIERGASPRPIDEYITNDNDAVNWIKIGDAEEGKIYINRANERITEKGANKSRKVYKGDFILSNSMSFGKPYILNIDGCVHDGWLIIRDNSKFFNKIFLYYLLISEDMKKMFYSKASGGVVTNLNCDIVKSVDVIVPSIKAQNKFSEIAELIDKQKFNYINKIKLLNEIINIFLGGKKI